MNQYQIASYVTAGALRAANQEAGQPIDAGTMITLSSTVSTIISTYGYKNHKAIKKAAKNITPDFDLIAEDFFQALSETPVIADVTRSKEYDKISEFVIEHKDLTSKERLNLYGEEYAPKSLKFWKYFRIVCLSLTLICILLQIGMYVFIPEYREKFLEDLKEMKKHAKKAKKFATFFGKSLKFLIHQLTK